MPKVYDNIEEVLACTRKILFLTPDGYLGLGASCFIVEYHGCLYIITARHALLGCEPDNIWVEKYPGARASLPIFEIRLPELPKDLSGKEYGDLAFIRVAMDLLDPGDIEKIKAFNLDDRDIERPFAYESGKLYLRGYPRPNSTIDYDTNTVRIQAFLAEALYKGPMQGVWGLHEILIAQTSLIETAIDMSGSPVVQTTHVSDRVVRIHLAGVLVLGSASSGVGHFIDVDFVFGILKAIHDTPEGEELLLEILRH